MSRQMIYGTTGIWLAVIAAITSLALVSGASMTSGTAALVLALGLVPPAILLKLWGGRPPRTVAEILSDRNV
jgi:hypothetical protein